MNIFGKFVLLGLVSMALAQSSSTTARPPSSSTQPPGSPPSSSTQPPGGPPSSSTHPPGSPPSSSTQPPGSPPSSSTSRPSSTTQNPDGVIVQGERVASGEIPYQAVLIRSAGDAFCGGSLIRPNFVLTAAHCVPEDEFIIVGLGGIQWNAQAFYSVVELIVVHEGWNPNNLQNDVAILRMTESAPLSNTIALVDLAPSNAGRLANIPARASGYGFTENMGPASQDMLKANFTTLSNAECRESHPTFQQLLTRDNICGYSYEDNRRAVCHGDSGGPLSTQGDGPHMQIGIASFVAEGFNCNVAPQAYVRVSSFRNWIDQTVDLNSQ